MPFNQVVLIVWVVSSFSNLVKIESEISEVILCCFSLVYIECDFCYWTAAQSYPIL